MIDYVKLLLPHEYAYILLSNPKLSFQRPVNEDTGEISYSNARIAKYRHLTFEIFPSGRVVMSGSIHKYHFKNNFQDFSYSDFQSAYYDLCETFGFDGTRMQLLQFEVGVNVRPSFTTSSILRNIICDQRGRPFSRMRNDQGRSIGIENYLTEYGYKIYDKGKQCGLPYQLIRYEIKYKTGKYFGRMNIENLHDLLDQSNWLTLAAALVNSLDRILFNEPSINVEELKASDQLFLARAMLPDYWANQSKQMRLKSRVKYARLVSENVKDPLKERLKVLIEDKIQLLNDS